MTVDLPGPARIDWAVESKHPGAAMGYALLCGTVEPSRARRLIEAGTTGTPADENAGRIDALPWVSFTADGTGSSALLAVVERSWSDDEDFTGQTIVPSRLLVVGWPTSKGALPGFVGLLALARSMRWTTVDGPPDGVGGAEPIAARPPAPMNIARIVETIDKEVGFDWVLSVAVALLDGDHVAIVTPRQVFSPQQRAGLLDAVCALLPYGCRAWISASTWARDRSAHPVRLSFADRGRPDQRVIDFDVYRPAMPRNPEAAAYLAAMTLLRSEGITTTKIVEHLAASYEPLERRELRLAVKHLTELRLVASTVEDIIDGKGDPKRVEEVLTRFGWRDLTPDNLKTLASFLLDTAREKTVAGAAACRVLRQHWTDEPLEYVVDEIVGDLRAGDVDRPARRPAALEAVSTEVCNEVVAAVLRRVASTTENRPTDRTVALLVGTDSPAPTNAAAWRELARCPDLGARLLRARSDLQQRSKGRRFRATLDALLPHQDSADARWVGAVRSLLDGDPAELRTDSLSEPVLAVLLDVAVARHEVRRFFAVAWAYVLWIAYQPDARGEFPRLKEIVKEVTADPSVPLLPNANAAEELLVLGDAKTPRLEIRPHQDLRPLAQAWRVLPEAAKARLGRRLPAAVLGKSMTPESFRTLVTVTDMLEPVAERPADTPGLRDRVETEVGDRLQRQPALLLELELDEQWANELVRYAPRYAWVRDWFAVRRVATDPDSDAPAIRAAYARLRSAGASDSASVAAIAPYLVAHGPEGLGELLDSYGPHGPNRSPHPEEIRVGVFTDQELRGLGVAYELHLQERSKTHLAWLQYVEQERAANRELMLKNNIPLPDGRLGPPPSPDTSAGVQPDRAGIVKRVWKFLGEH